MPVLAERIESDDAGRQERGLISLTRCAAGGGLPSAKCERITTGVWAQRCQIPLGSWANLTWFGLRTWAGAAEGDGQDNPDGAAHDAGPLSE
jgi:hypothetical protein